MKKQIIKQDEYRRGYEDALRYINFRVTKLSINLYYPPSRVDTIKYGSSIDTLKERMVRQAVSKIIENKLADFEIKNDFLELNIDIIRK